LIVSVPTAAPNAVLANTPSLSIGVKTAPTRAPIESCQFAGMLR
jgi:hypothetical protein